MGETNDVTTNNGTEIRSFFEKIGITGVSINDLTGEELEVEGYQKVKKEVAGLDPLFREISHALSISDVKKEATQKFNEAIAGSYKCILDPEKHLANIKNNPELFIGAALDNETNILAGQALFKINDKVLVFSKKTILMVFDGLSIVTSQYFMKQINDELIRIKADISGIKKYLDHKQQGELENAFNSIKSVIRHMDYIRTPERISDTMVELKNIEKVAGESIGLYRREIADVMKTHKERDSVSEVKEAMDKIHQNLLLYYYAVSIVNASKLTAIALRNINDPDELKIFKEEIDEINAAYRDLYVKAMDWCSKYLDTVISLNETNAGEKTVAAGAELLVGWFQVKGKSRVYSSNSPRMYKTVNNMFLTRHTRKKETFVTEHQLFKKQCDERVLLDNCTVAMDHYIDSVGQKVEIVSVGNDYYIKYLE